MIKAGQLDNEEKMKTLSNYLYLQGIDNQVESNSDNLWELWIIDSDNLKTARYELEEYTKNPDDSKYAESSKTAESKKAQEKRKEKAFLNKMHDRKRTFSKWQFDFQSVTGALMIISILITLLSGLGKNEQITNKLSITESHIEGEYVTWARNLPEIQHGQIWRLITPIFLHFSLLHIFFNMVWLKELGETIEKKQSGTLLLIMVIVIGVFSNLGQFFLHGPLFGGMSGVVYGLLGYVWIRGKFDPTSCLFINGTSVVMMIAWFFLCLFGVIPHVANTVHAIGLGIGMIWGYISAEIRNKTA